MTRISDMTALTALPSSGAMVPVEIGDGANYKYDLTKGIGVEALFVNASALAIPTANFFQSSGYSTLDVGSAVYVHDVAVDSAYVTANPRSSFIETGGRGFRLSFEQIFTPQMFGAVAGGVTDDSAAFVAALAFLKAGAITGYGYGQTGGARLFIPKGVYYLGTTTLDYDFGTIMEGESVGLLGPGSTVLKWAPGTTAFRTQNGNTTGATGTKTPVTNAGIATFRNLLIDGGYAGTESEAHGFHLRETACLDNVSIYNFAGDGVYMHNVAGGGAPNEGNSNCSTFTRVFAQNCRNGFNIDLADDNACVFIACNAIANRQWGVWDSSFLGNSYFGFHAQTNGVNVGSLSLVTDGTHRYFVKKGQEVGASTNAPSGSTADNTWWYYFGLGGTAVGITTWTSGVAYRAGGSYCTDDTGNAGNAFDACYQESDQPPAQFVSPTLVVGGSLTPKNYPVFVGAGANLRVFNGGLSIDNNLTALGSAHSLGPESGTAADNALNLDNTNVLSQIQGRQWTGGAPTAIGTITFAYGNGNYHDVANAGWRHMFRITGSDTFSVVAAGVNLESGKVLSVAGTQVVSARQTGTAAVATDPASTMALVNDLRAKLIAHGLIS